MNTKIIEGTYVQVSSTNIRIADAYDGEKLELENLPNGSVNATYDHVTGYYTSTVEEVTVEDGITTVKTRNSTYEYEKLP